MTALLLTLALTAGTQAATILDVRQSRSSTATSTLGFVIHGTGDGWRITGGWSWSPTISAEPVTSANIPATVSSPVTLDTSALEVNVDRWNPASTGYLVGRSPQGGVAMFATWLWSRDDGTLSLRVNGNPLVVPPTLPPVIVPALCLIPSDPCVPEPTGAVLLSIGSLALLRRKREGGGK